MKYKAIIKKPILFFQVNIVIFIATFVFGVVYVSSMVHLRSDWLGEYSKLQQYIIIPIFVAAICTMGIAIYISFKTKNRKNDPYRFSAFQYRFLFGANQTLEELKSYLLKSSYKMSDGDFIQGWKASRFYRKIGDIKFPEYQRINIYSKGNLNKEKLIIESYKEERIKKIFYFAIDNDTFRELDGIVNGLGLSGNVVKEFEGNEE